MRSCRESQFNGRRVAPREKYVRSVPKSARDPLGIQDHKFGRLLRDFKSEEPPDFGNVAWVDDSKIQFSVLSRNRNPIPIPPSILESSFRSQPGLAAMRSPCGMGVPRSGR